MNQEPKMNGFDLFILNIGGIPMVVTVLLFIVVALLSVIIKLSFNCFYFKIYYKPINTKCFYLVKLFHYYLLDINFGELVLVWLYFALLCIWFLFNNGDPISEGFKISKFTKYDVSNGFGRLALFNVILVVFPAHRLSIVKLIFGVGVEQSIKYHKIIGILAFVFTFVHFFLVFLDVVYVHFVSYLFLVNVKFYQNSPLFGTLAGIAMFVMALFSTTEMRKRVYTIFYYVHMLMSISMIIFIIFHRNNTTIGMLALPILLTLLDFAYRFIWGFLVKARVVNVKVLKEDKLLRLDLYKPFLRFSNYLPGQFVWIWWGKHGWMSHPFTITSQNFEKRDTLTVHIFKSGCFTKKLFKVASNNPEKIKNGFFRMDGPYGTRFDYYKKHYDGLYLVSNGSMIVVVFGILKDILYRGLSENIDLKIIWTIKNTKYLETFKDDFNLLKDHFDIKIFLGENAELLNNDLYESHSINKNFNIRYGRPDYLMELNQLKGKNIGALLYCSSHLIDTIKNEIFGSSKKLHFHEPIYQL